ncbi:MAG: filamentous hemagglutinin N-terminal domain-containing protein [Simkaniaceae bacterium]|nr:MAG: filamentous hemagglutinin N-terminal domain-containing protein [Simkaniaceae bacterium]
MKMILFFILIPLTSLVAAPSNKKVVAGNVEVLNEGNNITIRQHSDRAVVNWEEFSIGKGERVEIVQPSKNGALLNRVIGKNTSEIYGSLTSNGKVFLLNKNGILIGREGRIETAGFVASTLDIQDESFLSGQPLLFSGQSEAKIVNLGTIKTEGGDLFVLAKNVENSGKIEACEGKAALVGGTEILLKEDDGEQIYIRPASGGTVFNEGTLKGAEAVIKAAGENAYSLAINQSGLVQATGIQNEGGKIRLVAEQGITQVTGQLKADKENGEGGIIHILGDQVGLMEQAVVDGSGTRNGGEVLIGGDYQGKNPLIKNAQVAFIDKQAQVYAHSKVSGVGGRVIVWGDQSATHLGSIDVSGVTGGGFIEVSSPKHLSYRGKVDLSTVKGDRGTLFLDPTDIIIGNYGGSSNPHFPTSPGEYHPNATSADLDVSNLASGLNSGNVLISTSSSFSSQGIVTFDANLSWSAPTTLTINADSDIFCAGFPGLPLMIENSYSGSSNFTAMDFNAGLTAGGEVRLSYTSMSSQQGNIHLNGNVSNGRAIEILESTITSSGSGSNGGDITIQGTTSATSTPDAVYFLDAVLTSVDGNISIVGIGGNNGVSFDGSNQIATSGTTAQQGNIIITGQPNGLYGILIGDGSGTTTIETQAGNITLEASRGSILFDQTVKIGSSTTVGDISMVADLIEPFSQFSNLQIAGTGALTVQQSTASTSIGVGTAAGQGLNLPTSFLNALQNGFSARIFGRSDGTGSFVIGAYTHPNPLIMQNSSGLMQVNGALATSGGRPIQLISDQMAFNSTISGTGILTLQPAQSSTTIGIGNGTAGTLNLDTSSINNLSNGFSQIIIGRTDQNSTIEIGDVTLQDPVTLYGKQISVIDAVNAGSNSVIFNLGLSSSGILNVNGLVSTGTLQVNGGASGNAYAINVSGQTATISGGSGSNSLTGPSGSNNWLITGNNQGMLGSVSFTDIASLMGGSGNDQFTFNGNYQIDGIDGGGGTNTVIGPNVNTDWVITGNNQATMNAGSLMIALTNIQSLTGGTGTDTFTFNSGSIALGGTINGGTGSNTLKSANVSTTWDIDAQTSGMITMGGGSTQYQNIGTLEGSNSNDTFNLAADIALPNIDSGGGVNTLSYVGTWSSPIALDLNTVTGFQIINGPINLNNTLTGMDETTTWNIITSNGGTMTNSQYPSQSPFTFSNFPTLNGGSANDTFNLSANMLLPTIDAGGGSNTLNYVGTWTNPVTVDLGLVLGFEMINGPSGQDNTLIGINETSTWHVTGSNEGTLSNATYSAFTFTNFPNITGGGLDDTFYIDGAFQLTGLIGINGGGASTKNTLIGPDLTTTWKITANDSGTINGGGGASKFTAIEAIQGGSQNDTFTFQGAYYLSEGIDGGGGINTLIGSNTPTTWQITSGFGGILTPDLAGDTDYQNIAALVGGSGNDSFVLSPNITAPSIDVGGGVNTLTYLGSWAAPVTVDLNTTTQFQVINAPVGLANILIGNNLVNTWRITGNDEGTLENTAYPSPNPFSFTHFAQLNGGTNDDTFLFIGEYQISGTINGGSGVNILTAPSTTNTWIITGNDQGTLTPGSAALSNWQSIQNINGGGGNDTFQFLDAYQITGTLDGGGGSNTLQGPNVINDWSITGDNEGILTPTGANDPTNFSNIGSLNGGNVNNNYQLNGAYQVDGNGFIGGTGTNTITAPNLNNTWYVTADDTGYINPANASGATLFSGVSSIIGGSQNDSVIFTAAARMTGGIDGNGGTNSVTGPDLVNTWTIIGDNTGTLFPTGATGTTNLNNIQNFIGGSNVDTFTFSGPYRLSGATGINGGGGSNVLDAPPGDVAWTVTGNNAGTLLPIGASGATNFLNIPAIQGGSGNDTIVFTANAVMTGGINGNGGSNSVIAPDITTVWTIDGNNEGSINPGAGVTMLTNIQTLIGGSQEDTFALTGDCFLDGGIQGGSGTNTLIGPSGTTTWHVTGNNAGTIQPSGAGQPTSFTQVGSLSGGGDDIFVFDGAYSLSGSINGNTGNNQITGPNTNTSWTITGIGAGSLLPDTLSQGISFSNIESIVGGTGNDTITIAVNGKLSGGVNGGGGTNQVIGPNATTTWTVTADNAGMVSSGGLTTPLNNTQSFTGGNQADTFVFNGAFSLSGVMDGGGGSNRLTGPNSETVWSLASLTNGTLTSTGGGTTNYQNISSLEGGSGNDTFNLSPNINNPSIDAGGGINTLNYTGSWSDPASIDLNTTHGFQLINGPLGLNNTLQGNNLTNAWHITGDNAGTLTNSAYPSPTNFTFTNFTSLIGGTSSDAFIFDGSYTLSGPMGISGGSGNNTLTAPNVDNSWTITGNNAGNLTPIGSLGVTLFSNITSIQTGTAQDTIYFTGPFQISGGIVGNGTANTIVGPDLLNTWTITTNNGGTLEPEDVIGSTSFTGIQNLTGGTLDDSFLFLGAYQVSGEIDGGAGTNTLTAPNLDNTWNILSQTSGTLQSSGAVGATSYVNIGTLYGGLGNDTFTLTTNTIPPTVDAGSGINTINFGGGWTVPVTIDLNTVTGFQVINAPIGLDNTLIGNNQFNRWHITANDSGVLENSTYPLPVSFTFTNFPNLQGGTQTDIFFIDGAFRLTGSVGIDGGQGINSIHIPAFDTVWDVTSTTTGFLNPGGMGTTSYTNILRLIGNSANYTYNIGPNIILPTIHAGPGQNTLVFDPGWTQPAIVNLNRLTGFQIINAPPGLDNTLVGNNLTSTWNITGNQQGILINAAFPQTGYLTFTEFSNLAGGILGDTFVFSDGATLAGFVDGGAPATSNTLDYNAFSSPAIISLTGPYSGTASNLGKGFVNIGTIVGNYTLDVSPSNPVSPPSSLEKIQGLRTDLTLTLTKEIEYFQLNTSQQIYYNVWTSNLGTVLNLDDLLKGNIESQAGVSENTSINTEHIHQGQLNRGK